MVIVDKSNLLTEKASAVIDGRITVNGRPLDGKTALLAAVDHLRHFTGLKNSTLRDLLTQRIVRLLQMSIEEGKISSESACGRLATLLSWAEVDRYTLHKAERLLDRWEAQFLFDRDLDQEQLLDQIKSCISPQQSRGFAKLTKIFHSDNTPKFSITALKTDADTGVSLMINVSGQRRDIDSIKSHLRELGGKPAEWDALNVAYFQQILSKREKQDSPFQRVSKAVAGLISRFCQRGKAQSQSNALDPERSALNEKTGEQWRHQNSLPISSLAPSMPQTSRNRCKKKI